MVVILMARRHRQELEPIFLQVSYLFAKKQFRTVHQIFLGNLKNFGVANFAAKKTYFF